MAMMFEARIDNGYGRIEDWKLSFKVIEVRVGSYAGTYLYNPDDNPVFIYKVADYEKPGRGVNHVKMVLDTETKEVIRNKAKGKK
ncbi:MAG: hypothetical protein HYT73_00570 [Candidatus Aenigmarchaeota archaeon]|nr:hypothetical protein [Candidatus Aenigmarchaeota archaeon]